MSTNFNTLIRVETAYQVLIASGGALANGARAAVDYNNATPGDLLFTPYWEGQFTTGPPAAGTKIGDLWVLPGSGEGTERFPEGGDGTVGNDIQPAFVFYVGGFLLNNASTTINRIAGLKAFDLTARSNRFVFQNTSANTITAGWTLGIKVERLRQEQA